VSDHASVLDAPRNALPPGVVSPPLPVPKSSKSSSFRLARRGPVKLLVPVVLVLGWQLWSTQSSSDGIAFPAPADVVRGFGELWSAGAIQEALPVSLTRAGVGLLIGGALGLVFGVLNGLSRLFEDLFDLPLQVARVVPFIALLPLLTITVGIGEESKITLIAIACLFPVYINTFSAVRDVDRKVVEAGKVFGLNRFQSSIQIIMPMALPGILVGIRYSMGVSLLALIVAEQINANAGVGYIIWLAQNSVRIDLIITGIIIYALLGVLVDLVMKGIERAAMPWKRAEK